MEPISRKKMIISYVLTSVVLFFISALVSVSGIFDPNMGNAVSRISLELMVLIQLVVVLVSNLFLHGVFYYGGLDSSPIARGIGIGSLMGVMYFLVGVFIFDFYDLNNGLQELAGAISGRVIEYTTGGVATAVISVTDIHRWGILKAF